MCRVARSSDAADLLHGDDAFLQIVRRRGQLLPRQRAGIGQHHPSASSTRKKSLNIVAPCSAKLSRNHLKQKGLARGTRPAPFSGLRASPAKTIEETWQAALDIGHVLASG